MVSMPSRKSGHLRSALRDDALEREDALACELDDPALRAFVLRPRLHVPVARIVERGISGMQVETGLPAIEQRFEFARLFAREGLGGHAGQSTAVSAWNRDVAHIPDPIPPICA